MAVMRPFCCVRPKEDIAARVAALPYDVYSREEAVEEVRREPLSFLAIDRAETQFDSSVDLYEDCVYEMAGRLLRGRKQAGLFQTEEAPCYYIYELKMEGRVQTGVVACASIDEYLNGKIKKHENTREDKETDRVRHVDACNAQTGPIFLAYRQKEEISKLVEEEKQQKPLYQFAKEDDIVHTVWRVSEEESIRRLREAFASIDCMYIADGHHRAAAAVKAGIKRREQNPENTGEEEYNYFLTVAFPDHELKILDYNRVVKDLNGLTEKEFLSQIQLHFSLTEVETAYHPERKATFGMYLGGKWYALEAKEELLVSTDSVESLDVSLLQKYLLAPVLGIGDPRTDPRIAFVGGIRGLQELERRVETDMAVAFSMYPTTIAELFAVADEGKLMPPKSTWFEPKLRSGLFIHEI